jgi:AcrR family transcriptional regulator
MTMPTRETRAAAINAQPHKGRRETQRERLLAGMIAAANDGGYAAAGVSEVIARAGVSRPTFYEYFADRDDCFLAAHGDISEQLCAHIRMAVAAAPPEQAPQVAVRRLLARATEEPARAQFIANEAMAGGPRALDARDRTIGEIERIVETARAGAPPDALSPDLPTGALIGATHWLLSRRLRHAEHDHSQLADELADWIETYNQPVREHRWRKLTPMPSPGFSPHLSEIPTTAPAPTPSGRSRLSSEEIAQNQRWRILFATAQTAAEKGYNATTITDIATTAQLDKRVFYKHFRDKQQAFLAAHELAFQQTMAVAASGFFSASEWPERVWHGIHAASQFIATHPIAYLVHVESHAVGAPAIQRVEDSHAAFTIFLQEGNRDTATPQTRTAMEAIIAAVFEIGYHQFRSRENVPALPRSTYHTTYLVLAPYLGPRAANALIDEKLAQREGG